MIILPKWVQIWSSITIWRQICRLFLILIIFWWYSYRCIFMIIKSWLYKFHSSRRFLLLFWKHKRKKEREKYFFSILEHFCWCNLWPIREVGSKGNVWLILFDRKEDYIGHGRRHREPSANLSWRSVLWCKKVGTPRGAFQPIRCCKLNAPLVPTTKHQIHSLLEAIGKTTAARVHEKWNGGVSKRNSIWAARSPKEGFKYGHWCKAGAVNSAGAITRIGMAGLSANSTIDVFLCSDFTCLISQFVLL